MPRGPRHRLVWLVLIAGACALGIGSRRFADRLPGFVAAYAGDTLWAFTLFLFLGLIQPAATTRRIAVQTLVLSLLVEISQLYHARWIDAVRQTTLGGLIMGFGFLWSDLVCYASGVALGTVLEWVATKIYRFCTKLAT
jgi:hypothetical protein